jgi:transketolase
MNKKFSNLFLRDAFIVTLKNIAVQNKKVILLTNDQGAPELDDFKKKIPQQFYNSGISEQNIIAVSAGLALAGYVPFIYSINSFIIYRTIEHIKIDLCSMNLPVKIFGVGSGYSYPEDGPTHHSTEDIGIARSLSNLEIFNPSDSEMTSKIVKYILKKSNPCFVRLDRQFCYDLKNDDYELSDGFRLFKSEKNNEKFAIISSGFFLQSILKEFKIDYDIIDLFCLKKFNYKKLLILLKKYSKIVCIEEHVLNCGIGSIFSEIILDNDLNVKLLRLGLLENKVYNYGNRNQLLKENLIDIENLKIKVKSYFK